MKLGVILAIFAALIFCSGCGETLFKDDFEADTIGNPPSTSPPGAPSGDSLNLTGPAGSITVTNSVPHGSKAVKVDRPIIPGALECITAGSDHTDGIYNVRYKAYSVYVSAIPTLIISVRSTDGQRAFELKLSDGNYQLLSGGGSKTLTPTYAANVVHSVLVRIIMAESKFSLEINDVQVASDETFLDAGFGDVHLLRFEYEPAILEALPGSYVIDEITIKAIR